MIYLKIRSDSKQDSIKREHVIFTQACLRSRQRRANYFYVSASAVKFGVGGRGVGGWRELSCWYLLETAKNLYRLTGWSFRTTKFFNLPPSSLLWGTVQLKCISFRDQLYICFLSKNHSHVKPVYNLVCSRASFVTYPYLLTLGETKQGNFFSH